MHCIKRAFFLLCFLIFLLPSLSYAVSDYFQSFKENILSYFPVINGKVVRMQDNELILDKGRKDGIRKGQRIIIFEETVPLIHPVTKQIIGKSEKIAGSAEIINVEEDFSSAQILEESSLKQSDSLLFKIPKSKVKVLFAQGNTEWAVGEAYYRELKNTERFELIDAPVNVDDIEILFKNSKSADILLLLKPSKQNGTLKLSQELYWIKDRKFISSSEIELSQVAIIELRKKYASLIVPEGHTLLSFRLSRSINRVATGDFDGISKNQILIVSDKEISLYLVDVDLKLRSNFEIPVGGEILWFDTGDIDGDGKDEIVITTKKEDRVVSSIIKWTGNGFQEISRLDEVFLRIYNGRLIAQAYSVSSGFEGEVFYIVPMNRTYQRLESLKLPVKANIYDFYNFTDVVFKWEDEGFLSVYNDKGVSLWRSSEPLGFGQQHEKKTGIEMLSLGKWKIHSRIKPLSNGVIVIEKKPLLGFVNAQLLGYRSSKLKLFQWTGISVEETDITEEMSGEIVDYSVFGDRLFVLVKPPFGMNPKRLLQGESPFESILHILSFKY